MDENEKTSNEASSQSILSSLPDSSFAELCGLLGCSRAEVESAMSATHVSPEEAFETLKAIAPTYIALKGAFETRRKDDVNGAFCLVANGLTGEVIDSTVWVGSQAPAEVVDLNAGWESMRGALRNLPLHPDKQLYANLEGVMFTALNATSINAIFRYPEDTVQKTAKIKEALSSAYRLDLTFQLKVERFHKIRIDMTSIGKKDAPPSQETKEEASQASVSSEIGDMGILCKPILDPVRGKAASTMNIGDVVMVTLDDSSAMGKILEKVITQAGKQMHFPVKSAFKLPSGDIQLNLLITEGVTGIIRLPGEIKIRLAEQEAQRGPSSSIFNSSAIMYILLVGGVIAVLFALAFYMLF